MMQQRFVGVDVSMNWLDVYHSDQGPRRVGNTPAAAQAFAADCLRGGERVVFEVIGGYDATLRAAARGGPRALLSRSTPPRNFHHIRDTTPGREHLAVYPRQLALEPRLQVL